MSDNQNESQETVRKNRRSSFFQRRVSLSGIDITINSSEDESNKNTENEEEEKLKQYLNKLKKEEKDWDELLLKTKKETKELEEMCSQVVTNNSNWEYLTEEDKQFLADRPDYVGLGRLLDRATEAVAIRKQLVSTSRRKLNNLVNDQRSVVDASTAALIESTMNNFTEFDLITE